MCYVKSDFFFDEDMILEAVCHNCGNIMDMPDENIDECDECHSDNIHFETSHEGLHCVNCGVIFEPFTDGYLLDESNDNILICEDCYDNLPNE